MATLDKKSRLYLLIVIIVAFIVGNWLLYYIQTQKIEEIPILEKEETIIEKQLRELGELRGETQPLTEEEMETQLKELEKLRQEVKPPSEEKIQKQLEELEKLRQL